MKKTALSGIQTSGHLHLGNYLGSIKNWLSMQDEYDCYFFLADLHSITVDISPEALRASTMNSAAIYLASGIDPKKSTIFKQSSVKEHSELAWMLNCITPIGWLKRMTQFKDKAGKKQDSASTGLFTYPILMAADILLYNADVVPVGDDQKQHLELARDIAGALNRKFGQEVLKVPEPMIQGAATRVMSLRDGTKKMSKSDESEASRINLTDSADVIMKKLKKSKTDSIAEITYNKADRPEVANLINIFSALTEQSKEAILGEYEGKGFAEFKTDLAEVIIAKLAPINAEYQRIMQDPAYINQTLEDGAARARSVARRTCDAVAQGFGLV
ncbi:MAG: tryptophan--tRNA ligase [Rickettsiales bacterium]|nr:MAG: tryptophan--tRNA ligase [Rickettsiales bacterium]